MDDIEGLTRKFGELDLQSPPRSPSRIDSENVKNLTRKLEGLEISSPREEDEEAMIIRKLNELGLRNPIPNSPLSSSASSSYVDYDGEEEITDLSFIVERSHNVEYKVFNDRIVIDGRYTYRGEDFWFGTVKPFTDLNSATEFYVFEGDRPLEIGDNYWNFSDLSLGKKRVCKIFTRPPKKEGFIAIHDLVFYIDEGGVAPYRLLSMYLYFEDGKSVRPDLYKKGTVMVLTMTQQSHGTHVLWSSDGYVETLHEKRYFIYRSNDYVASLVVQDEEYTEYEYFDGEFLPAVSETAYFDYLTDYYLYPGNEINIKKGLLYVNLRPDSELGPLSKLIAEKYKEGEFDYPFRYKLEKLPSLSSLEKWTSKFEWRGHLIDDLDPKLDSMIDEYSEEYRVDSSVLGQPSVIRKLLFDNPHLTPRLTRSELTRIVPGVPFFSCTLVKAILDVYASEEDVVLDMNIGLGDRMLGSIASNVRKYVGFQPIPELEAVCENLLDAKKDLDSPVTYQYFKRAIDNREKIKASIILSDARPFQWYYKNKLKTRDFSLKELDIAWGYLKTNGKLILVFDSDDEAWKVSKYLGSSIKFFKIVVEEDETERYVYIWTKPFPKDE